MNVVVILDARAGELEKILSGTKSMLLKDVDPASTADLAISPGDSLYFLRDERECDLRVKATVTHVLTIFDQQDEGLSHTLKEMQPKLQLTEEQYNEWSVKQRVLLVEFGCAQKIGAIHITPNMITNRSASGSHWFPFVEFNQVN